MTTRDRLSAFALACAMALVFLAARGCVLAVRAAPAPLDRPPPRLKLSWSVPARATLIWHGAAYRAEFSPCGAYRATLGPDCTVWVGRWRPEGDGRVRVQEWPEDAPGSRLTWVATVGGGGSIRIEVTR